ncbi:Hexapeptide repeat of succinyl-transferase [Mucilaginibacter pineti]|uniref:Hexapeptide repeat of succinyl-transferase n=1 Tax=Mucilaginibacter pineti TaxID=1391627 RepID=A0A1G6UGJ5_9SPHI|nr:DapH/DapD/GlmU-related protein [Mucilaginibacter pineti]SDD39675.1 Hexapeptide repeat of succinyl-transferase [Mucilaginibacter pineti]
MRTLIEKIICRLKNKPDYKFENNYSFRELYVIILSRGIQVIRGGYKKLFFRASNGLVFIGTRVVIDHIYQFAAGSNLIIEDNVYINALSLDGILIKNNVSIARNCTLICTGVISQKGKGITIGNNSGINAGTYMGGQGGIEIGDNVIIGPGVKIFSENHNFSNLSVNIKDQGVTRNRVYIGNNCWVGAGVTILAGVTIGEGCVIAAGSIVTKTIAPHSVVAGVPGRILKKRSETIEPEVPDFKTKLRVV